MDRIHLDFQSRHAPPDTGSWWLLVVAIAAAAALAAYYLLVLVPLLDEDEGRLQSARQTVAQRDVPIREARPAESAAGFDVAGKLAGRLALPWPKVFAAFEEVAEQPVALLTVEVDGDGRTVVLTGEARDFDVMTAYYQSLQRQPALRDVVLQTHQVNRQDRDKPLRFRIAGEWVQP